MTPRRPRTLTLLGAFAAIFVASAAPAEVTKTLKTELSGSDVAAFAVENLVGTMKVLPGEEGVVRVVATIHAESQALADGVRMERMTEGGAAVLRVRYPDGVHAIRYRAPSDGDTFEISLGLWFSGSSYHYDGHSYRVSSGHGKAVWADLEVRVPPHPAHGRFQQLVGLIESEDLEGGLGFEVASADMRLRNLGGDLSFSGSSGDIRARDIRGSWKSEFSSGDVDLDHFDGDAMSFRTSSGDLSLRGVRARVLAVKTSSGDASIRDADVERFDGDASSGDFVLSFAGNRLQDVQSHSSSGNVTLRLPADSSFEAVADQSSGDMEVGFADGSSTRRHDKLVAYRRGSGATRIRVETSSGDLAISPR